jgi:hypothetical protein
MFQLTKEHLSGLRSDAAQIIDSIVHEEFVTRDEAVLYAIACAVHTARDKQDVVDTVSEIIRQLSTFSRQVAEYEKPKAYVQKRKYLLQLTCPAGSVVEVVTVPIEEAPNEYMNLPVVNSIPIPWTETQVEVTE